MASNGGYECKGCRGHFDDSCEHLINEFDKRFLTTTKKCLKEYSPDELLTIFKDQLQIFKKKISCEKCKKSFTYTFFSKHLSSKELCKEYYKADEKKRDKWGLSVTERRNYKRRLDYAIKKLTDSINSDVIEGIISDTYSPVHKCCPKTSFY